MPTRKVNRYSIDTVPLPEKPMLLLLDKKSIRVISNAKKAIVPGGTVSIGTWPTPEKGKKDVAIDMLPTPEASVVLVVPQQNIRMISNVKGITIKGGTVSIGTWPTPEKPRKGDSSATIRVLA
jgi:hypothetical protein